MAAVERPDVVYLDFESDSDSEDLPNPPVRARPKHEEPRVIVLSDSSDDEDIKVAQKHSQRLRANDSHQRHSQALKDRPTRPPMQATTHGPEQWHRLADFRTIPMNIQQSPLPQTNIFPYPAYPARNEAHIFQNEQTPAVTTPGAFSAPFLRVDDPTPEHPQHPTEDNEIHFGMLLEDPSMMEFLTRTSPPPRREAGLEEGLNPQNTMDSISYEEALVIVLDVLPDVCTDFVRQTYDKRLLDIGYIDADSLLADLLAEKAYPKQKPSKKRKRGADDSDDDQDTALKEIVSQGQMQAVSRILRSRFPTIPVQFIDMTLRSKKTIFDTLRALISVGKTSDSTKSPFRPLRRPRAGIVGADDIGDAGLAAQFEAAYQKIALDESVAIQQQKKVKEDAEATQRAFELNDISDCQCCFDTFPNAKMVVCDSETPHTFCMDCLTGHVKAQMDLQKHEIRCMDGSSCKALFSRSTKQKALDATTFARLERIEQQNVLRESGLDLDQCPFCDFAAICPPVEEDRELRCQGPECGVVSCRLCEQKSHIPLTCEEHKKEQGVDERHIIEEEMTKAFLRMCPKCKIPIYKDGGCNKITCSRCRSHICDVCGKDITKDGYSHFGKKCPQQDERDGAQRAAARVRAAEQSAKENVLASNPDLSAEDLEFKMSEKLTKAAKKNGLPEHPAFVQHNAPLALPLVQPRRMRFPALFRPHQPQPQQQQHEAQMRHHELQMRNHQARAQQLQRNTIARQDYQRQLALLEAQNQKRRQQREQNAPVTPTATNNPRNVAATPPNRTAQATIFNGHQTSIQVPGLHPAQNLTNPAGHAVAHMPWTTWPLTPWIPNQRPVMPQALPMPGFHHHQVNYTGAGPGFPGAGGAYAGGG